MYIQIFNVEYISTLQKKFSSLTLNFNLRSHCLGSKAELACLSQLSQRRSISKCKLSDSPTTH